MFETLKNVFRVKEMRRKLLYVLWMILVIRIGSQLPVPGVDSDFFKEWFAKNTGDAFNFFDAFTGIRFKPLLKEVTVDSRYRKLGSDSDHEYHPDQIEKLSSHFLYFENTLKSLKH